MSNDPLPEYSGDRFLNFEEVEEITKIPRSTWYMRIRAGDAPRQVKIGPKSLWSAAEVAEYVERKKAERAAG